MARPGPPWRDDQKQILRDMYLEGEMPWVIASRIGKATHLVAMMIQYEIRVGRLVRRKPVPRMARARSGSHPNAFKMAAEPVAGAVMTYEENGVIITRFPPGFAHGVWHQPSAR